MIYKVGRLKSICSAVTSCNLIPFKGVEATNTLWLTISTCIPSICYCLFDQLPARPNSMDTEKLIKVCDYQATNKQICSNPAYAVVILQLLLSGDIEMNPGPNICIVVVLALFFIGSSFCPVSAPPSANRQMTDASMAGLTEDNPLTNTTEQINDGTTGPTEDTSILANGDKIAITSLVTSIVFPILLFVASTILNVKDVTIEAIGNIYGRSCILRCRFSRIVKAYDVTWYKHGKKIENEANPEYTILTLTHDDEGVYYCVYRMKLFHCLKWGTSKSYIMVEVKSPEISSKLEIFSRNYSERRDRCRCTPTWNGKPEGVDPTFVYEWCKNGEKIKNNNTNECGFTFTDDAAEELVITCTPTLILSGVPQLCPTIELKVKKEEELEKMKIASRSRPKAKIKTNWRKTAFKKLNDSFRDKISSDDAKKMLENEIIPGKEDIFFLTRYAKDPEECIVEVLNKKIASRLVVQVEKDKKGKTTFCIDKEDEHFFNPSDLLKHYRVNEVTDNLETGIGKMISTWNRTPKSRRPAKSPSRSSKDTNSRKSESEGDDSSSSSNGATGVRLRKEAEDDKKDEEKAGSGLVLAEAKKDKKKTKKKYKKKKNNAQKGSSSTATADVFSANHKEVEDSAFGKEDKEEGGAKEGITSNKSALLGDKDDSVAESVKSKGSAKSSSKKLSSDEEDGSDAELTTISPEPKKVGDTDEGSKSGDSPKSSGEGLFNAKDEVPDEVSSSWTSSNEGDDAEDTDEGSKSGDSPKSSGEGLFNAKDEVPDEVSSSWTSSNEGDDAEDSFSGSGGAPAVTSSNEINKSDSVSDPVKKSTQLACPFKYYAVSEEWQRITCQKLELEYIGPNGVTPGGPEVPLIHCKPNNIKYIRGDGNCLFRTFSWYITGSEDQHKAVRKIIVAHMRKIGHLLLQYSHINKSIEDYIKEKKMDDDKEWGTDVEIFSMAHLLKINIFVFSFGAWRIHDSSLLKFIPTTMNPNERSIYIVQPQGNHFEVVKSP